MKQSSTITGFQRLITAASLAAVAAVAVVAAVAAISATAPAAAARHSHSHATEATTRSDTIPAFVRLRQPLCSGGSIEELAARWVVNIIGYAYRATDLPMSVRPYVELQHNDVRHERGPVGPHALYGASSFWDVSFGMRLFFGGGQMRMGSYGLLDPMAADMRPAAPSR